MRHYCATGRIEGACLIEKTWNILENAIKPKQLNKKGYLDYFRMEYLK